MSLFSASRIERLWRVFAVLGTIVVLATAAFHLTGYADASKAGQRAGGWYQQALPMLWAGFSLTLTVCALAVLWASFRPAADSRVLLGFNAVLVGANSMLLFVYIGNFAGAWLLAFSALAISAGWFLVPYSK